MIRIDRVHIVTDAPLNEREAREAGLRFAADVNAALRHAAPGGRDVRIGELQLNLPRRLLGDAKAMAQHAHSVAGRLLEHGRE